MRRRDDYRYDGDPRHFWLPRYSDEAFMAIVHSAAAYVSTRAPALADWLAEVLGAEVQRRRSVRDGDCDMPIEASELRLDTSGWNNVELAQALGCATVWSYAMTNPEAGLFVDEVVKHIVTGVQARLVRDEE